MPESVRRSLWPVIFSTVAGMLVYMVMIALNAGAMEQRVKAVELERVEWAQQQKAQDEKLDKMLNLAQDIRVSLARVEAQLEAHSRNSGKPISFSGLRGGRLELADYPVMLTDLHRKADPR